MVDPLAVLVAALLVVVGVVALCFRDWYTTIMSGVVTAAILAGISYSAGWPANIAFPDHAIIYGLTSEHVWAGTKAKPMPPRAYQFEAPPEWFEERDRRRGQPFEVERREQDTTQLPGRPNPSDRWYDDEPGWMIVQSELPPKD